MMRAIALLLLVAGCPVAGIPLDDGGGACSAADLAGDGGNPSCGSSAPAASSCSWACFFSPARGYEWQTTCCDDCGPLPAGIAEPCAWRCTFDQRAGGSFQWEQLYQGCSR